MEILTQLIIYINSLFLTLSPFVQDYTEGVVGQPDSFLPSQAVLQTDKTISTLVYRGLFKYDIYGTILPDLAETWEISEDGLSYTIKLKDNQFWSNGKKITADDLIYTSFKVPNLAGVATDKVDDLTVRYTLPNKYSPFLSLLTVGVMPLNSEENENPLHPVTSGPFRISRVERSGSIVKQVILLHEETDVNIRRLVFRFYANEDELVTAAHLGEIDGFLAEEQHELDNFTEHKFPLQGVYYSLYFNLRQEDYQDEALRKNLAEALPIDEIIADTGIPVQGPISRSVFTDQALNFNYYNKNLNLDLSDKTVVLTIPDLEVHEKIANRIKDIWEDRLNINVKIEKVAPDKMLSDVIEPRNFGILLYGQEIGRDPDRYTNWHSTQKDFPGLNLSGFEHVRADRALEEGRNEPDNDKRVVHYAEFQKVVHEQIPAVFLYHPFKKYYVSDFIQGIGEKYTFNLEDRFLDYSNWSRVSTN